MGEEDIRTGEPQGREPTAVERLPSGRTSLYERDGTIYVCPPGAKSSEPLYELHSDGRVTYSHHLSLRDQDITDDIQARVRQLAQAGASNNTIRELPSGVHFDQSRDQDEDERLTSEKDDD